MDYSNINKVLAEYPLTIMNHEGALVEFTSFPSYGDVALLCGENPVIHPDREVTGKFSVQDNTILECIREYRMEMSERGLLTGQLMGALDDLADTVDAYYAGEAEEYINDVLTLVGDDAKSLSVIFNGLMAQSEAQLARNDVDGANVYMSVIEYLAMSYPHLELSLQETYAEKQDPIAALQAEIDNAGEDDVFMEVGIGEGEGLTVPINEEVVAILCETMPVFPTDYLEELILCRKMPEHELELGQDILGLLQAQQDELESIPDTHEDDARIIEILKEAQGWAYQHYFAQISEMASDFLNSDIEDDDLNATVTLLGEWVDEIAQIEDAEEPDLFSYMLSALQTEIRDQQRQEGYERNACRAQGVKDKENGDVGDSVFCVVGTNVVPHLH